MDTYEVHTVCSLKYPSAELTVPESDPALGRSPPGRELSGFLTLGISENVAHGELGLCALSRRPQSFLLENERFFPFIFFLTHNIPNKSCFRHVTLSPSPYRQTQICPNIQLH